MNTKTEKNKLLQQINRYKKEDRAAEMKGLKRERDSLTVKTKAGRRGKKNEYADRLSNIIEGYEMEKRGFALTKAVGKRFVKHPDN